MESAICNLCGLTCWLGDDPPDPSAGPHGLVNATVAGGYESTPGNGNGALDDCTSYHFSMCEFCLDWLFSQFKVPVRVCDGDDEEPWKPAHERVIRDDWRRMKDKFFEESRRRGFARSR